MRATKGEKRFLKRMGQLAEIEAKKCGLDPLGFQAAYIENNLVMEVSLAPSLANMDPQGNA